MRLIDADALEKDYRSQFESVYKNIRDTVMPSDFYIERKAAYDKKLMKIEMEAFFEYLQARPTVDAVEGQYGFWMQENSRSKSYLRLCSVCRKIAYFCGNGCSYKYCPNCGAKMVAKEEV